MTVNCVGVICIGTHVNHVVSEFFLGHDAFFLAIHNEVAAVVIAAFAGIKSGLGRHAVQDAGIRLQHDGKSSQTELF